MPSNVRRVGLPSGGWWDISTRPTWADVSGWGNKPQGESDPGLVERALASLTTAWSFAEEISLESVALRDAADLVAVLEAALGDVRSRVAKDPGEMAEDLFAALAVRRVPPQFEEVHLMAATGWSWETLQRTPADVVEKMAVYLAVVQTRDIGGALEFDPAEEECSDR